MAPSSAALGSARDPVLVTGASGFVGAAVAAALRREGYSVRVLVRASSPRTNIDPADEVFVGDMRDRASVAAAMRGARYRDPRRRRLPALGALARRHRQRQCRRHPHRHGGGARAPASSASSTPARLRPSTCATAASPTRRGRFRSMPRSAPTSAAR